MPQIIIEAPAKLNLHLKIGGKRPDGFHEIQSIFLALAFGDTLCFQTVGEAAHSLEIAINWHTECHSAIPPGENIIEKAVALFRSRTGWDRSLKISVEKRIPLGGGLGGGSSDAAATLLALKRLASLEGKAPPSDADLLEMGALLGSDVPFFLHCAFSGTCAAWVSGRGEEVMPLDLPESFRGLSLVLVNPGFPSNTAAAFALANKYHRILPCFSKKDKFIEQSLPDLPRNWAFTNDFFTVFQAADGESGDFDTGAAAYGQIISQLRELGADFAGLSGSGSTCFGVFLGGDTAGLAEEYLLARWSFVINTFFACTLSNTILQ